MDLKAIAKRRVELDALAAKRTGVRAELAARTAELELLRREGKTGAALTAAEKRVATLETQQNTLAADERTIVADIGRLADALIAPSAEAAAVATLDARVPVAMLPVRIETRFAADRKSLAIRIFPDQIHLDAHEPEFTEDELAGATWYWEQRWPAVRDAALAGAAWETIAGRFRPGRARYLIDTLRPSNLDQAPSVAPVFPAPQKRASEWTRPIEATALPERWVAVGYQDGAEVFRRWTSVRVPDRLAAGPSPRPEDAPPPPAADAVVPPVQQSFQWALDPRAAADAGLLLNVTDADLPAGRSLARGLSRLVVFGVDWTLTPDQASGSLEALLRGHAAVGDLGFVAPGTPTNNTGASRSGFSRRPADQVDEWAPPVTGADPDAVGDVAARRLAVALGIAPEALAVAPGAGYRHHRWAGALIDALWEATGGYYLSDLLAPLGDDDLTSGLREHAAAHAHPSGALPTLRVGPQPYGVLPIVATARFAPVGTDRAAEAIARVGRVIRSLWMPLTPRVPRLGAAGPQRGIDGIMLELLQRTPVPWKLRWRELVGPPQWSATDWLGRFRAYQAPYLYTIMGLLGVPSTRAARVQYLTGTDESHPLPVPLVRKGDAGIAYLGELAALARDGSAGRRSLNLRQNSLALLEALLAHAAVQELDKGATAELASRVTASVATASGLERKGVRTPDLVRVEAADVSRAPYAFRSARELAEATVPDSPVLLHDQVATRLKTTRLAALIADRRSPGNGLARYLSALDALGKAPEDELEWAFRGVLDLYSTRLDTWLVSLASSRLAQSRRAGVKGVHLGCYGWVEELRPRAVAPSLGHVLAPSLSHAVGAAVLRSGRRSHDGSNAFDVDLSSARVRDALSLLEGVAAGQSVAALVGYRIERALRDAGLADLTVPLRLEAPLQARDEALQEPVESVAARDVVDGVRLLRLFGDATGWAALVTRLKLSAPRRTALEKVLRQVAARYDAVSDVLFSETVHQAADGNLERAGAASAALDRQERPVLPDVTRTPRTGAVVTNRVLVALRDTPPVSGWPARGIRARTEPRLDRWLGLVLGPPQALSVKGTLVRAEVRTDLGVVTAADLGLSPLALVLSAQRPAGNRPSELEARVAAILAARVVDPGPDDAIEFEPGGLLSVVATWAGRLVAAARALDPTDLVVPGAAAPGVVDAGDLAKRADAAVAAVRTAAKKVRTSARTPGVLRATLAGVAELVGAEALPVVPVGHLDEPALLVEQAVRVQAVLDATVARVDAAAGADPLERIRLALGAHQPVLPVFTSSAPAELAASVADRTALLGADVTAPLAWLQRAALVRPELDPLSGLMTHAEASQVDVVGQLAVAQLPHRPGARWCELPYGPEGPPPAGTVGMAVFSPGGFDPSKAMAGLFVDTWAEVIPAVEHTAGLTFHYDAPGARPPQAVLLAVHPQPDPQQWDLDTLLETVNEAIDLAHVRALSLKEIEGFAGLLPALFLPNNYTRDVPSLSFKDLLVRVEAAGMLTAVKSAVAGKGG